VREREGLITRILQLRRAAAAGGEPAKRPTANLDHDQLRALEARITHLEQLVQGLQDSVHRESSRHSARISELEARTQPAAMGKALSDDARARGL
jgi:TolA-binding protein